MVSYTFIIFTSILVLLSIFQIVSLIHENLSLRSQLSKIFTLRETITDTFENTNRKLVETTTQLEYQNVQLEHMRNKYRDKEWTIEQSLLPLQVCFYKSLFFYSYLFLFIYSFSN